MICALNSILSKVVMSILDWFAKKEKNSVQTERLNLPGELWIKCPNCSETLFLKDLELNKKVCTHCNYHYRLTPEERVKFTFDVGSFKEFDDHLKPVDFLGFKDTETYTNRIKKAIKKNKSNDAVTIGTARLKKQPITVAIMNFGYMGGSMGSVVGEKITRAIEKAIETKNPLIIFTSSGGARMQESTMSLMQMAKTSGALHKLANEGVPFISVLCDPTTGGTSASFAMLGDINIAEPGALISFAGPRVIEQTIRQKLPKGFQRAEFLLEHGMVDRVIERKDLKDILARMIAIVNPHSEKNGSGS